MKDRLDWHRTRDGRIVYDRKKHHFSFRDLLRIVKQYPLRSMFLYPASRFAAALQYLQDLTDPEFTVKTMVGSADSLEFITSFPFSSSPRIILIVEEN